MLALSQVLVFLPAALLVSLSPGPNNVLAFRNGMRGSTRSALAAVLGRLVAFTAMLALVVVGLSAVLSASQVVFLVLKWVGAAYLIGIGLHILWGTRRAAGQQDVGAIGGPDGARTGGARRLAVQEFITAAANPKALLVFTAFLPQFVDPLAGHSPAQLALLGSLYLVVEAAAAAVWIVGGRWVGHRRLTRGVMHRINRAFGMVFVGLGGALAMSSPEPAGAR